MMAIPTWSAPVSLWALWTDLLARGRYEPVKASVHAALGLLAASAAVYNTAAYRRRHDTTNAINAAVYGALVGFEVTKVAHHLFLWQQDDP